MQAILILVIGFIVPFPAEPLVIYLPMPTMQACEAWRADPTPVLYQSPLPTELRGTKCVPRPDGEPT